MCDTSDFPGAGQTNINSLSFLPPPPALLPPAKTRRTNVVMRSAADSALIDGLPTRVVIAFRNSIYRSEYVASNASMFLDNDWINMDQLKHFLARPDTDSHPSDALQTRVKLEFDASTRLFAAERQAPPSVNAKIKTRTLKEGNKEVLEILSDSDSEVEDFRGEDSDDFLPRSDAVSEATYVGTDLDDNELSADESESDGSLQDSDTLWLDDGLSSRVRVGEMRVTSNVTVQRVEYVPGLPSAFPIPEIATAFVVDLHDAQYNLTDKHGKLYTVDALIKNKDNDSFKGPTEPGDSKVLVTFEPGQPPILCRRSRLGCKGSYACEHTDTALLDVVRRDLHPATRDAVFTAQWETRRQEGRTRWTSDNTKHTGISIPDDVDPDLFLAGFNRQPLAADNFKDPPLCSAIVHPTTGLKSKKCAFTHIVNGEPHTKSAIMKRPCAVQRRIYIPMDPSIRKALIVHPGNIAHNHPIPAFKKVSHEHKAVYKRCIQAAGCVGATVAKVDNAPSTKLLLGGKKPGELAAALQSSTVKQRLVHETKLEAYPEGLGVKGAFQLFFEDMKKGVDEHYIQRIAFEKDGGVIILASLMRLLDDAVTSFENDTTFKRIAGEFNEWEVVIFLKALQRAVTIARAYINGSSADDSPVLNPPNFNKLQTFGFSFLQDFGTLMLNGAVAAPDFQNDYDFLFAPIPEDPVAPSLIFEPQPPFSPSAEWPRLPPVPLSSPPHPEPAPVAPQLELPPPNASKKRKARAEVDQGNAIYTKRPRKTPRRRDE
ncbi:hypothetical protein DFH09DRAFT_1374065 [Mycena vulgaris]|nr:hypothetical protein DFH09DRAFT_1374065 [Mycena vulgaris]